jgi:4-amino-4-deoxy-L-arabinose transferase-like glycosyltransferase
MKHKLTIVLFLVILSVGAFLRVYQLGDVPPGVNRDEAAIGYTAYSLLQTGKDEYGRVFPVSFESFGDWKLPGYIYLTIPFISLFGLTDAAVRLPSVLAGIATVALTFLLVKQLFSDTKLALISMALIAISPWHLHFSRAGYEANLAVFFVVSGVLLFLKSLKGRKELFIGSMILFALTYYTYHGNHVFTTLFIGILLFLYWVKLRSEKTTYIGLGVFVVLVSLILSQTLFQANETKLSGTGIFGDPSLVHAKLEIPRTEHGVQSSLPAKLVHNKVTYAGEKIFSNYLQAFSPDFLFIKGGSNRTHNILQFGNMYLIEAPFLLLGFMYLFTRLKGRERLLLLGWLLIAPIAASITKDAPHSTRMFAIFPVLPIVTAMGAYWFWQSLKPLRQVRTVILAVLILLFMGNIGLYLDRYYVHFPHNEADYWGIGYEQMTEQLLAKENRDKTVVIEHPEYSPYIFLLFYGKVDPALYQKTAVRYPPTTDGFSHVKQFGRFHFRSVSWDEELTENNKLLVGFGPEIAGRFKESSYNTTVIAQNPLLPLVTVVTSEKKKTQ